MSLLLQQIQESNATEFNRYPGIFSKVAEFASESGSRRARVLSFGCSTGEEVASLDRLYLTGCELVGVDISEEALGKARRLKASGRNDCSFLHSSELNADRKFEIVMALSVLCRWPDTKGKKDIARIYSFDNFEEQLALIDTHVVTGGVLVLHNTNYYFEDTSVFSNSYSIAASSNQDIGFVTRFDVLGKRYVNQRNGHVFFRKIM